jgi:hypothetical protein
LPTLDVVLLAVPWAVAMTVAVGDALTPMRPTRGLSRPRPSSLPPSSSSVPDNPPAIPPPRQGEPLMHKSRIATLTTLVAVVALTAPASFGQTSRYDTAHVDYEIGHYEQAFATFASLADEGNCDAARLAQQMVRYGRPLYAIDFKVSPERLQRWQRLPACPVVVASAGAEGRRP